MNKSFLKYAGSKAKSLPFLLQHLPKGTRLIEPFVGSGVVFLNTEYDEYVLGDVNSDIINTFTWLKNTKQQFINDLREYFHPHNNAPDSFNLLRQQFNTLGAYDYERALLFVYLNRHCFNGVCRYNSSGHFNVPFGKYDVPYFPLKELQFFIEKSEKATFVCTDYLDVLSWVEQGDVVYCDPPFISLNNKTSASLYTHEFNFKDHQMLYKECLKTNVPCFISNHDTPDIRNLYLNDQLENHKVSIETHSVRRVVSPIGTERNMVSEILVKVN